MIFRYKSIILVTVILIIAYFFISVLINLNNDKKFIEILQITDKLINDNSYDKVDKLLFNAAAIANSPLKYKQILKRVHKLKNFKAMVLFSEDAYKKYPKDKDILSIFIYSLLKTEQNQLANNVLQNLKENTLSKNIIFEASIKTGNFNSDDNIFYQAIEGKNIFVFNKLYQLTKDKNIFINSVLLYLENGNYNKADIILSEFQPDNPQNKKLLLLTKYDNGNYEEVSNLLIVHDYGFTIEEMLLIQIDISLKMQLYNTALIKITDFIKLYNDYSVIPYINLIYLNSFIEVPDITYYTKLAAGYFTDNRILNLVLIEYYILNDNEKTALEIANQFIITNIQDKEFELIYKQLKGATNPEIFINNIYELVNKTPLNIYSSRYLAWNLFKNNNFYDLEIYLDKQNAYESWVLFFKAILLVYKQEQILSLEQFQKAYNKENNWETLYNMGIISTYFNDYQSAVEYFQNSENSLVNVTDNLKTKSFIRTKLATTFYDMQNYNNAFREVTNALELDNSNLKAHLLLKKLESSNY